MTDTSTVGENALLAAHQHCKLHFDEISASTLCGCFYCLCTFSPAEITDWIADRSVLERRAGRTALCPQCGIDSVIGSASGFVINEAFLKAMRQRWFDS
jgi:hypothetical protein